MSIVFYILLHTLLSWQDVPSATAIIKEADEKMRGTSSYSEMTMRIERPDWSRDISMKSWAMGNQKSLILILSPARDRGIAYLKRDNEIWNWQPRIDRDIKLPPSMMMQSWMGSDFTNDDLVRESSVVEDYTHHYLGDTVINQYPCYKIELRPKEDAPVVWGKIHAYIEKKELMQLLIKYFDEDGFLVNIMELSEIKNMDGRVIPTRMEMIPADKPGQKTIIVYENIDFDIDISDNFFSLQNMKRVK